MKRGNAILLVAFALIFGVDMGYNIGKVRGAMCTTSYIREQARLRR